MNKKQVNRKEMHDIVISFLDANAAKWSAISKVGEFKNEFHTINQQIEVSREAQQAAQVHVGGNKQKLKSTIAEKADILNDAVEAFAVVTGNEELESRMSGSFSDLNEMRNTDFIIKLNEIVTETEGNMEILSAEYGVTSEQVDDLKMDIDHFLELNGQPRVYQVSSVQATKSLEQLFSEANEILTTKLDKIMKIFKRRDPNFYNGYIAAREVVDN